MRISGNHNKAMRNVPWSVLWDILLAYLCYGLCRAAFCIDNSDLFSVDFSWSRAGSMIKGAFLFDTAAIVYTNALWLVLVLFPLHWKERRGFHAAAKWLFVAVNAVCLAANLCDTVYFPFRLQRTTATVFSEFGGNTNLLSVFLVEIVRHWYLTLLEVFMAWMLWRAYVTPAGTDTKRPRQLSRYYARRVLSLLVLVPLAIGGTRGGFTTAIRPLAVSNAHEYVGTPIEAGIVLNTPFSILRTWKTKGMAVPRFYGSQAELDAVYSPVHLPADTVRPQKKNVVIIIVESFAKEFVGALNRHLDRGQYQGYTTFVDSLLPHCMYWEESFANGSVSIDAMPSVLASLPKMFYSYVLSPYSLDHLSGLASLLGDWGYQTAFFHGAENSSMGFQAFARAAGFGRYYGRTEYEEWPGGNGDRDFDGTWAIWDEPFLQFFCHEAGKMRQPFLASVFTASSHHPFALPDEYKDIYKDEGKHALHKCIRYTDNALRRFFEEARRQPWYANTIFVITADHASSKTTHEEYMVELGHFKIPIIFYDPTGKLPVGPMDGVAQQTDIMPTVLGLLGYGRPYIAFGADLLSTPPEETWAFSWNHVPMYIKGDLMLQMDNDFRPTGLYRYRADRTLKRNLLGTLPAERQLLREAKAVVQSCLQRMSGDSLKIKE